MPRQSLVDYLDDFLRHPGETAYVHRRGYRIARWSFGEIAATAFRFARELEARGIGKGDRILLWGDDCAEWVAAFLAAAARGVVVVPIDRMGATDFARRVSTEVRPRLLVASRGQEALEPGPPRLDLEDLPARVAHHSSEPYRAADLGRSDPVEVVFTSGTTAEPKGVVLTHGNILANLEPLEAEIGKYLRYERLVHPIRFLDLLPLSHVFGQFLGIFIPQLLRGTVIFQDSLNPSEVVRTIHRERVSVLVAVPRLMQSLRDKVERDYEAAGRLDRFRAELRAAEGEHFVRRWWRFRDVHRTLGWKFWAFISGGAALDADTEQFWTRLGFVVIQGYGLTETTSLVSVNHPFRLGRGSIGKVLPGREVKLDATGEILVRGENVASAYWQGSEIRPVTSEEGWLRTGDLGELDGEGNLYFKGRRKNVIVTPEGMNVYPEDLEAALRRQPEVRDCVVVGLAADGNAEPCGVLLVRNGMEGAARAVEGANSSLAEYQRLRRWLVWPEEDFPRTSTQKPRTRLIEQFAAEHFKKGGGATPQAGSLSGLIARITGRPVSELPADANLSTDLSLTSVERVELLSALEDRYQVELNESKFSSATTVGEIERMLRQPVPQRSDYRYPRWAQRWPVTWLRLGVYYLVSCPATFLMARPEVRGRDELRGVTGPLLVVANHVTQVDIGFVMAALPWRIRNRLAVAMQGELLQTMRRPPAELGFFRRLLERVSYGLVVALFNVFPLPQQTGFRASFAYAGESADRGYSIVVFPEGRRTQDGNLSPFRAGVGMLAQNLALPVVPVRIDGLFALKRANTKWARPGAVTVTIGAPVRYEPGTDPAAIAEDLEARMESLERKR